MNNTTHNRTTRARLVAAAFLLAGLVASAETYSWDFGTDPGKDDASAFTLSKGHTTPTWGLTADAMTHDVLGVKDLRASAVASKAFDELGAGRNFTLTARANYDGGGGNWSYVQLLALGTAAASGSGSTFPFNGIGARVGTKGKIRIMGPVGANTTLLEGSLASANGGWFNLTLSGVFTGNNLVLTFTAVAESDGSIRTLTHTIVDNTFTGKWFGFAGYSDERNLDFDTFTVTTPPPAGTVILLK